MREVWKVRWWLVGLCRIGRCDERTEPVFEEGREMRVARVDDLSDVVDEKRYGDVWGGAVDEILNNGVNPCSGHRGVLHSRNVSRSRYR